MKKYLFFICSTILLSISFNAHAHDFYAINNYGDTIYYKIISSSSPYKVAVTYKGNTYNSYRDTINIPTTVIYNSLIYSVTSIGNDAFNNCNYLTSVIIGDSVTSIGGSAFSVCSILNNVIIGNSVKSIDDNAFGFCGNLATINIPKSVTSISNNAFFYCNGLTSINVDSLNSNYTSNDGVLYNKLHDTLIRYPEGKIGLFTIPSDVNSISNFAFFSCERLTSIIIPNSVKSIGDHAFSYCTALNSLIIGDSVTSIGDDAFSFCYHLYSVIIPNSVTSIGNSAFVNCIGLTSVNIPTSVSIIGHDTFRSCRDLFSITIPSSIISIGNYAFEQCDGLTSISCLAILPPTIYLSTFTSVPNTTPIYVPCSSVTQYQAVNYWNYFTNIQGLPITNSITASICQGEVYTQNGFNADTTGVYTQNLQSINGCDSIVSLTLTMNELIAPNNLALNNISNGIELTWKGNGERYIIYRGIDSIATTTDTIFQDTNVVTEVNYCYKIKALNSGCESELSDEVCDVFERLNDIKNSSNIYVELYPNPTNDKTKLEIEGLISSADVIVYDISGRKLKQYKLNKCQNNLEIDVKYFAKGIYNIKVVSDKNITTRKLIVR